MTPHDWIRVRDLFDSALALDVADRAAFLDRECAEHPVLRAEVASLLAAHDGAGDFIESPVYEVAPELLADPTFTLAGRSIGPYLVRHEIGRGGMGVVYLADDTRLSRRIALKAIAPGFQSDNGRRERLRQEARAAAALSHPGIATVYAIEEIDDELYLACEYVAGPTLRALIDSGPMPADLVLDLAAQLAHALAAAHGQGVVHRDLKPENIVRTASGTIKVLDFGVARIENVGASLDGSRLTAAGIAIGTPGYMSPEQIRHEDVDFRADLFAFGVVLYEMATGTNPFDAKTATASIARILEAEPAPLHFTGTGAFAGVEQVVTRCLRKRREDRYDSTLALIQDLEQLQRGLLPAAQPAAGDASGSHQSGAHHRAALWWWECHQVVASVVYALMVYPAFRSRLWIPKPWSLILFFSLLAAAATAVSVRLHLYFTSRSYPSQLASQRAGARPWTRWSDAVFAIGLLLNALAISGDHSAVAALLLAVSVAVTVSMLIIEPATAGAAFSRSGTPLVDQDRRPGR
ncbi:MAG: serine/threonine-protein kinase [Acidobacteriota bacterium]